MTDTSNLWPLEIPKGAAEGRYLSPADVRRISVQLLEARAYCARLTATVEMLADALTHQQPYRLIAEDTGE